jgi:HlyD family secretion protein
MSMTAHARDVEPKTLPHAATASGEKNGVGPAVPKKSRARSNRRWWLVGLAVAAVVVLGGIVGAAKRFGGSDQELVYYTVVRADLPITVTERGTIESQENVRVLCEIDDIDGDGIRGTPIQWLIGNGESVKKGQLIVELESSGHQEQLDRQILDCEKARAEQIQAQAKYDNQITQNQTTEEEAELQIRLAELELKMFKDPEKGTHKLEVEEINRLIDDANNEILASEAELDLAKQDKEACAALFKLGYASKSELDTARTTYLKAEGTYAATMNKLRTQLATLKKKETYEREMQLLTLEGKLATAKRTAAQVKRDNQALLDQAKAALNAANRSLKKEEERLNRYTEELKNCKIYAPADGMVAYAVADSHRFWLEEIRPGAPVRNRQHILSIPNLKKMQVKTAVHESVLDQISEGQQAIIRIEAFPDRHFQGQVKTVAVLADQQSTETKVYDTIVTIDGEVEQLKPGMTAVVDIHVNRVEDALSVPVQAIVQVGKESWCYVDSAGQVERRKVTLGLTNHKFVEVRSGLAEGDRVILNPMVIVDKGKEDEPAPLSPEGTPTAAE